MYILKNSLKNLMRNKGRNILLLIIMIATLSCTAVSVIINTTSNGIIQDYKNSYGSEVFIQPNQEKVDELSKKGDMEELYKGIPTDVKTDISKSKYLKETIFTSSFGGYSSKLKALDEEENKNQSNGMNAVSMASANGEELKNAKTPNLNVLGGLSKEGAEEFKNGKRKITEGKMPEKSGEALISEDFAKLNKLKVGDKIKIQNPEDPAKYKPLELTISGIYFDSNTPQNLGFKHPMLNRKNEIITTFDTLKEFNKESKSKMEPVNTDVKYFLNNPDDLEAFNKEAHAKGLSDLYDVSTDAQSYNNIVKPIEGLKKISNIFMVLVLAFGGSILILISILSIRERKYEIGVLRAMGMKKDKVALGLVFETISLILISLIIGIGIGNLVSSPVSNMILKGQLEAQNDNLSGVMVSVGAVNPVKPIETITTSLSLNSILAIGGIAILLGLISAIIGILYINRYEPRKILTERN
ncbi:ABC transporter permease [Clostridium chrysemydis]|uniref:ABC transporter permease n=1 Tax=Clostridium chrysemydis TaxID=2665504 RepID=UPI0018848B3B|nr:ABC transporter permease [Clostridium chrysemydis]